MLWRKVSDRQHATVRYDPAMDDWIQNGVRVEDFDPSEDVERLEP
jgi:hypothetical protein